MKSHGIRIALQRVLFPACTVGLLILVSFYTYGLSFVFVRKVLSNKVHLVQTEDNLVHTTKDALLKIADKQNKGPNSTRKILLWTPLFSSWHLLDPRPGIFDGCLESRCQITNDRNAINDSDALVFHIRTFVLYDMPIYRDATQKWIFFSMEAPPHSVFPGYPFMYNMFNWTMSYRSDSDVHLSYGEIISDPQKKFTWTKEQMDTMWKSKTKMAVWMSSNCKTDGRREAYVDELQKHIDVDVFGYCGIAVCQRNETPSCLRNFAKKYKFYFSFENSICQDYVTEKFFGILQHDIVPVVFGNAKYDSIAPKHSFINALDYSPADLARYLLTLANNATLYFDYLMWKEEGYKVLNKMDRCKLCSKLHSEEFYSKSVYADIGEWWIKQSSCKSWDGGHNP